MSDYNPAETLQKEVERFFETNRFHPMEVTNFYAQAKLVLQDLTLQTELARRWESSARKAGEQLISQKKKTVEARAEVDVLEKSMMCTLAAIQEIEGGKCDGDEALAGIRHHIYGTQIKLSEMRGEPGPWDESKKTGIDGEAGLAGSERA